MDKNLQLFKVSVYNLISKFEYALEKYDKIIDRHTMLEIITTSISRCKHVEKLVNNGLFDSITASFLAVPVIAVLDERFTDKVHRSNIEFFHDLVGYSNIELQIIAGRLKNR